MGAPPVAEPSDLSEWPRSADDDAAPSARKLPGTATGHWLKKVMKYADVVELVDSLDLGAVTSVKVFRPAVIANQTT